MTDCVFKLCSNCEHFDVDASMEPCNTCFHSDKNRPSYVKKERD